jgi:hypothetical protein
MLKNPPTNLGDPLKVSKFLKGLGDLKTNYTEKASQIRGSFDKLTSVNKLMDVDSAMGICKLNMSTNILSMQKMGLTLRDANLSSSSFGGFLKNNPLQAKGKLGGFKL